MQRRRQREGESLLPLVWRLKRLKNQKLATRILWLAAEGRLEWLADGRICFWTQAAEVLESLGDKEAVCRTELRLAQSILAEPTRDAPADTQTAAWCALDPKQILSVKKSPNSVLRVTIRSFTVLMRLEREEVAPALKRLKGRPEPLGRRLADRSLPLRGPQGISRSMLALLGRQS